MRIGEWRGECMKEKKIYAKDYKCNMCGKQAIVFRGLNDPDATQVPYCRKCADKSEYELMVRLNERPKNSKEMP